MSNAPISAAEVTCSSAAHQVTRFQQITPQRPHLPYDNHISIIA